MLGEGFLFQLCFKPKIWLCYWRHHHVRREILLGFAAQVQTHFPPCDCRLSLLTLDSVGLLRGRRFFQGFVKPDFSPAEDMWVCQVFQVQLAPVGTPVTPPKWVSPPLTLPAYLSPGWWPRGLVTLGHGELPCLRYLLHPNWLCPVPESKCWILSSWKSPHAPWMRSCCKTACGTRVPFHCSCPDRSRQRLPFCALQQPALLAPACALCFARRHLGNQWNATCLFQWSQQCPQSTAFCPCSQILTKPPLSYLPRKQAGAHYSCMLYGSFNTRYLEKL